jgi:hypothetical protein
VLPIVSMWAVIWTCGRLLPSYCWEVPAGESACLVTTCLLLPLALLLVHPAHTRYGGRELCCGNAPPSKHSRHHVHCMSFLPIEITNQIPAAGRCCRFQVAASRLSFMLLKKWILCIAAIDDASYSTYNLKVKEPFCSEQKEKRK